MRPFAPWCSVAGRALRGGGRESRHFVCGHRSRARDHLYGAEFAAIERRSNGASLRVLTAFSRDGSDDGSGSSKASDGAGVRASVDAQSKNPPSADAATADTLSADAKAATPTTVRSKVYVQHRIEENAQLLFELIHERGAAIYVAG